MPYRRSRSTHWSSEYEASIRRRCRALKNGGEASQSVREAARIELGLRAFLQDGGFKGFTDTFEDLHGLAQLPGHCRRSG